MRRRIDAGRFVPEVPVARDALRECGADVRLVASDYRGRFEPREIKVGQRGGGYIEVRDGLREGEPVVTSANFLIDAESNLKAALKGLAGGQP